ncbi:outer membrane protein assembly factor BamB family protein [Micavibrio aeruginosavorus]|uniref:PQQ enzyme repeat family protein n=1 Tax=Micavibrio aeruginosavorus (strain ARL-13) TaxID=856793 RepID=G2KR41_MICAA|nr:PQQ-binding-like beta-propeller repeat protein [Micavibrio aeruginosavorus]AEP08693.1 PQQ enzyme repeat family protein [Micavibrio aeruginosavorus ARL-13]
MKRFSLHLLLLGTAITLAACGSSDDKAPLPGTRISVLEMQRALEPDDIALDAQGFIAPQPWKNEFWPQTGGYPNHAMQHLSLSEGSLKRVWKTNIGDGGNDRLPLVSQPVVIDGRVYTIDTRAEMSAFDVTSGKRLWSVDIAPEAEEGEPVIAGGIAYSQGQLFVTNGYAEILVMNPKDGTIAWRKPLPAPSRAAPTVMDGRVFVMTMDNKLLALNTADGALLWEFSGLAETTGLLGAASPAASREMVVPAFSSGEIFALRVENGSVAWTDNLTSFRRTGGLSGMAAIRGLPVLDKGMVIAVSYGGRIAAIDERTGARVWQRDIPGSETPWVAGNHVFMITANNELIGMSRDSGAIAWVKPLPKYENPDKRKDAITWTGPVLAGGRLFVASSHGYVLEVSPATGEGTSEWRTEGPVHIAPIVAGDTLYILSDNGTLAAYK